MEFCNFCPARARPHLNSHLFQEAGKPSGIIYMLDCDTDLYQETVYDYVSFYNTMYDYDTDLHYWLLGNYMIKRLFSYPQTFL